jgi:hypothetical protein
MRQSLDLEQAREFLDFFLKEAKDLTPEQEQALANLEYALINAKKLQTMFFGMVDQVSVDDVKKWKITLEAMWRREPDNNEQDAPRTLH